VDSLKNIVVRREWIFLWWTEASTAVVFDAGRLTPAFAPLSTICTATAAAGLTADRSTRRLQKPPVPTDAFLNLPSLEWISGPTNRRQAAFSNPIRSHYGGSSPVGSFRFCPPRTPFAGLAALAGRSNRLDFEPCSGYPDVSIHASDPFRQGCARHGAGSAKD
jgi:hypothetical protein